MEHSHKRSFSVPLGCLLALLVTGPSGAGEPRLDAKLDVREEWHRSVYGLEIGNSGLFAADIDLDGTVEVVTAGEWFDVSFWYVLSYRGGFDGSGYAQEWVSEPFVQEPIHALRLAQIDNDPAVEVLIAIDDTLQVYDGATRRLEREIALPVRQVRGLAVADVDGDGRQELVLCNSNSTWVQDLTGLSSAARYLPYGCWDVAVGQVDADPFPEIVIANDRFDSWVLDGRDGSVEWAQSNPDGFGQRIRLVDLDGDGIDEIVAGRLTDIRVYDAATQSQVWRVDSFRGYLRALRLSDLDADGRLELIYGTDAARPELHILDAATGAEIRTLPAPQRGGFGDLAVANLDRDPGLEIVYSFGNWASNNWDALVVHDAATDVREWVSPTLEGDFPALAYADVDFDGRTELLYAPQLGAHSEGSAYFVHDARSKRLEVTSPTVYRRIGAKLAAGDSDSDPQLEIFFAGNGLREGQLSCFDGLSHEEQWTALAPNVTAFASLALGDFDGDGQLEAAVGVDRGNNGPPPTQVSVFDGRTGALEWASGELGLGSNNLAFLRTAELDGDKNPELVVAGLGGRVAVLSPDAGTIDATSADLEITALDIPDLDGDGDPEIVVGTSGGAIHVLDPATGAIAETLHTFGPPLDALAMHELTGDWILDAVVSIGGRLAIYDGFSWQPRWTSPLLNRAGIPGRRDSLLVGDFDQDGRTEITLNSGNYGILVYEVKNR